MKFLTLFLLLLPAGLSSRASSQQLAWGLSAARQAVEFAEDFGDYDLDGGRDLLCLSVDGWNSFPSSTWLRVYSGATGALLANRPFPLVGDGGNRFLRGVGDWDGDGYPDYVLGQTGGGSIQGRVRVFSMRTGALIFERTDVGGNEFGQHAVGDVFLDGDGHRDIVVGSTYPQVMSLKAYSGAAAFSGAPLWTYDAVARQQWIGEIEAFPDVTGDGRNEILLGGLDGTLGYSRGIVCLINGATGQPVRTWYDSLFGGLTGYPISIVGDVDRDGIADYAAGNYWSWIGVGSMTLFSGATGSVLNQWTSPGLDMATGLVGGSDIDQDGLPDLVSGSALLEYATDPRFGGRIQCWSSRDYQRIGIAGPVHALRDTAPSYGLYVCDLGPQPGSPYPHVAVFAFGPQHSLNDPYTIVEVWRLAPPGVTTTGLACRDVGSEPKIGVRTVTTAAGVASRIVLSSAPQGALATCLLASASETTIGGLNLPYALDGLGFLGCSLQVPPSLTESRIVGTTGLDQGYAAIDVPFAMGTSGFAVALQWVVLDFATGGYGSTQRLVAHLR